MVSKKSAVMDYWSGGPRILTLPIKRNHSEMVKFPNEWDENYGPILNFLREFRSEASVEIPTRFKDQGIIEFPGGRRSFHSFGYLS
jgi:hypothetical protein